jgi:hypothetical protein
MAFASRGDVEEWLELMAASVVVDVLVLLQEFTGKRPQLKRGRERMHEEQRGGSGSHHRTGF